MKQVDHLERGSKKFCSIEYHSKKFCSIEYHNCYDLYTRSSLVLFNSSINGKLFPNDLYLWSYRVTLL